MNMNQHDVLMCPYAKTGVAAAAPMTKHSEWVAVSGVSCPHHPRPWQQNLRDSAWFRTRNKGNKQGSTSCHILLHEKVIT